MPKKEYVERYDLEGKHTHTDVYIDGKLVGRDVDRFDLGGEYDHTDQYDESSTWNKTGTTNKNDDENSGCFITTAVCSTLKKPDDCEELTLLRNFRDTWLAAQNNGSQIISEYYHVAPRIVSIINDTNHSSIIYTSLYDTYIKPCIEFIKAGLNYNCFNLYCEMINSLKTQYITE